MTLLKTLLNRGQVHRRESTGLWNYPDCSRPDDAMSFKLLCPQGRWQENIPHLEPRSWGRSQMGAGVALVGDTWLLPREQARQCPLPPPAISS